MKCARSRPDLDTRSMFSSIDIRLRCDDVSCESAISDSSQKIARYLACAARTLSRAAGAAAPLANCARYWPTSLVPLAT